MHILLVNDDGISAKGIAALLHEAVARGYQVTVCAPASQQSAASHRITLTEPLFVSPYETGYAGVEAYAIKGTPADCVRLGLLGGLARQPVDVVISGINAGYNAGVDVHYSGTVGAAMEGSMCGCRAIAASAQWKAPDTVLRALASLTMDMAQRYCAIDPLPLSVMNINAPAVEPEAWQPTVYAPLNRLCYQDSYQRRESPFGHTYYWLGGFQDEPPVEEGSDLWYLNRGHVTVSMLTNFGCLTTQEWNGLEL